MPIEFFTDATFYERELCKEFQSTATPMSNELLCSVLSRGADYERGSVVPKGFKQVVVKLVIVNPYFDLKNIYLMTEQLGDGTVKTSIPGGHTSKYQDMVGVDLFQNPSVEAAKHVVYMTAIRESLEEIYSEEVAETIIAGIREQKNGEYITKADFCKIIGQLYGSTTAVKVGDGNVMRTYPLVVSDQLFYYNTNDGITIYIPIYAQLGEAPECIIPTYLNDVIHTKNRLEVLDKRLKRSNELLDLPEWIEYVNLKNDIRCGQHSFMLRALFNTKGLLIFAPWCGVGQGAFEDYHIFSCKCGLSRGHDRYIREEKCPNCKTVVAFNNPFGGRNIE